MSAKKRTSLDAVFGIEPPPLPEKSKPQDGRTSQQPLTTAAVDLAPTQQRRAATLKRPNVKQHTAYLPLAVHEQLRKLAFEEDKKMHDYLVEGLDRVFADRGLPAIEDLS